MFDRRTIILAIAFAVIWTTGSMAQDRKEDPFDKLKGIWVADQVLSSGNEVQPEKFPFELHFAEGKLTFKFVGGVNGKDRVHDLALDASKIPFTMDITRTVRDQKMTVRAIYKFDGERLLICSLRDASGQPTKERPTSFDSSATVPSELLILKRKPTPEK